MRWDRTGVCSHSNCMPRTAALLSGSSRRCRKGAPTASWTAVSVLSSPAGSSFVTSSRPTYLRTACGNVSRTCLQAGVPHAFVMASE